MKLESRNPIPQTLLVFFLLLSFYLAFSGDRYDDFQASDEWIMFQTTRRLVEKGSLRIRLTGPYWGQEAKYGLGQSLAAVPLYLAARALMPLLPESVSPNAVAFPLACATNAAICAAVGAMFFALALRLGYRRRVAIAGAFIVGTTTILAAYSKDFFSEPLVALCLLGAAGAFAGSNDEPLPARSWFRAGAWLALAILTRIDNLLIIPVFLAGLWLGTDSSRREAARRGAALFLLPLVIIVFFILWTNYLRSGRLAIAGYGGEGFSTFFPTGLFGLLFSPAHGVLWFSPPLAIALAYALRFHGRHPRLCFVVFATFLVKLFVFAKWWNWFGGWCWGSRFLLPVVPLAMLALLEPLSRWRQLRRVEKALIAAACAAGLIVQVCGLLVAPNAFHSNIQFLAGATLRAMTGRVQPLADREQVLVFSPPQSPLVGNWPIAAHGPLDWFGLRFGQFFPPHILTAIFVILALILVLSAWRLIAAALHEPPPETLGGGEAPLETKPLPRSVRRAAWIIFGVNILFFAALSLAVRSNGLWRTDREEYPNGQRHERSMREPSVYLDESVPVPTGLRSLSTTWQGYLDIATSGTYTFYTVAWGAFELQLATGTILYNPLGGDRLSMRVDGVPLACGVHPIRLQYETTLPQAQATTATPSPAPRAQRLMQLYWTTPGGGEYEQVISRAWFYPTLPGPAHRLATQIYRLKIGFVVVSLIVLWWIWLKAVLCPSRLEEKAEPQRHEDAKEGS